MRTKFIATPEGSCPRRGQYRDFPLHGVPGATVTVVFAGPTVGREYAKELVLLSTRDAERIKKLQAQTSQAEKPWLWVKGFFTTGDSDPEDNYLRDYFEYLKRVFGALIISVNGLAGFEPDEPAEVEDFVEYLSVTQAQLLLNDALRYNVPDLKAHVKAPQLH